MNSESVAVPGTEARAAAPAKINLTLRIVGRRGDGYHEVESVIVRVGLSDTVSVRRRAASGIELTCDRADLPTDAGNLAYRAARLLLADAQSEQGVAIHLKKQIPSGAGLGGGSSDAATTLDLVNRVCDLRYSTEGLAALAGQLGADVPLFLWSSPCVVRGTGTDVEPLDRVPRFHVVLVLPEIHCATADVYRAWKGLQVSEGAPAGEVEKAFGDPAKLLRLCGNDLEPAAFRVVPALAELSVKLREAAGQPVRMSGSGSAFFTLVDTEAAAAEMAEKLQGATGVRCIAAAVST